MRTRRRRRLRKTLVISSSVAFVGWTAAAFVYGMTVGERRRVAPPAPPPEVVVNVQEVGIQDTLTTSVDAEPLVRTPNVLGLSETDARTVFGDAGFDPAAIAVVDVQRAGEPGVIVNQDPAPGTMAPAAITLERAVALDVPIVIGAATDDAMTLLEQLGAVVTVVKVYQEGAQPGTVLAIEPPQGPLPVDVVLTSASGPATMDLAMLEPVQRDGCDGDQDVTMNGVTGESSMLCRFFTLLTSPDENVRSVSYSLGRHADVLTFTAGVTDESLSGATATLDVVADGTVVQTVAIGLGQPAAVTVDVTGVLRIDFIAHSTTMVADPTTTGPSTAGRVAIIDAVLTGSPTGIEALSLEP